jgi:hypothetical protein
MIMLSYEKIKMTLKNMQQEEQKTRWKPCTSRKTQDTIVQTRNKKKEMTQTSTSTWSAHHKHKTIESDTDNAQWEQRQHCTNDESEKNKMTNVAER